MASETFFVGKAAGVFIRKAIDSCIENGILEDVLRKNRAEVLHMFLTEYDEKKHMRTIYREGYEKGEEVGKQAGYKKGEYELLEKQIQKKLEKGKDLAVIAEELETELSVVEEMVGRMK